MQPREEMLYFSLALVSRGSQKLAVIIMCQMRSEQPHNRGADGALRQQFEDDGKASRRTRGLDAAVRGVF